MASKREANAATGIALALAGSVAVSTVFPVVEHVLNVAATVGFSALVLFAIGLVVRDVWL